jgi:hypothetical protein
VTDVAAHLEQLAMTADDLASAAQASTRRAWWAWRRRSPKADSGPGSCQRCGASGDDVALETLAPGRAECSSILACLARRHGQAVLSAADVATVVQALADAEKWLSYGGCECGDGSCPEHRQDAAKVTRYAALGDRLAPSGTEGPA